MNSRITVESKIGEPSTNSTGTSPRGLAARKSPGVAPEPMASGVRTVKGTPFSARAILTFWA
jgi:hypothetical protein